MCKVMPLLLWALALRLAAAHGQKILIQDHLGSELRTKLHPVNEHVSIIGNTGTHRPVPTQTGLRGARDEGLPRHEIDNLITLGTGLEASVKRGLSRFLRPLALLASGGDEGPAEAEQTNNRPKQDAPKSSAKNNGSGSLRRDSESTNEAAGKLHPNNTLLDEEEEEEWTFMDHAANAMLIMTRIFLVVVLVLVVAFCYCCGIGEDFMLCCGVLAGFSMKTKMQMAFFLLLNVAAFLIVWQVKLLRPVLYMGLVFGLHGLFCCGCIMVVLMELTRGARSAFEDGVEFLGYLDDKVDDMLDYLGLSDASSDDDVTTTCWGTPVRRAEKAPDPSKTEEVKTQPISSWWTCWTEEPKESEAGKVTGAKGRPLVGERNTKKKKPRTGKAKTVK
mmetsp:Transcript_76486/g.151342  ORF Transcript_76486/g.151342 Transcript_76486/m.151342 type:complete len:389 (-) Transcript_76486:19-1185(-)